MIAGLPINRELIDHIKKKLYVGNLRSIQLNCIPGRSISKMDFSDLKHIDYEIPYEFLDILFTHSNKFNYIISFDSIYLNFEQDPDERQKALGVISKRLNHLSIQNKQDLQEYGYESFGFGFPIVVFRPQDSPDKLIRAPLFIWRLTIEKNLTKSNSWKISRNNDHEIQYNDLLRSYLNEICNLNIEGFEDNGLSDSALSIDEIMHITAQFIHKFSSSTSHDTLITNLKTRFNEGLQTIPDNKYLEETATTIPFVYWSGIFGRFHQRNESIRREVREDLLSLCDDNEDNDDDLIVDPFLHSETSVPTDPSQLEILNFIKDNKHVVIQGPPGTGKSQTITAIILNALEQGKRTLVVCEKKTAMDVLVQNMKKINPQFSQLIAVIEDVTKDRKEIVNSVRDRYEYTSFDHVDSSFKNTISSKLSIIEDRINEIHRRKNMLYMHSIDEYDNTLNWNRAVGLFLKSKYRNGGESLRKELERKNTVLTNINLQKVREELRTLENLSRKIDHTNSLCIVDGSYFMDGSPIELKNELENLLDEKFDELDRFIKNYDVHLVEIKNLLYNKIDKLMSNVVSMHEKLQSLSAQLTAQRLIKRKNWWYRLVSRFRSLSAKIQKYIDAYELSIDLIRKIKKELGRIKVDIDINKELSVDTISIYTRVIGREIESTKKQLEKVKNNILNSLIENDVLNISLDNDIVTELKRRKARLEKFKESSVLNKEVKEINVNDLHDISDGLKLYLHYSKRYIKAQAKGYFDNYDWNARYVQLSDELQNIVSTFQEKKVNDWENQFAELCGIVSKLVEIRT